MIEDFEQPVTLEKCLTPGGNYAREQSIVQIVIVQIVMYPWNEVHCTLTSLTAITAERRLCLASLSHKTVDTKPNFPNGCVSISTVLT